MANMCQKAIAAGALALWTVPSLFAQGATEDVAKGEFLKYWRQVADNEPPRVEMRVDAMLAGPQGEDAYRVRERDGALVFSGANARSCLYAVYAFFELIRRSGIAGDDDGLAKHLSFTDGNALSFEPAGLNIEIAGFDIGIRVFAFTEQYYGLIHACFFDSTSNQILIATISY